MRAVDRWAIDEQGIPSLDLMESAGIGVARVLERVAPDGMVAVVCGKGNNGGDGLVAARILREAGREVAVICASALDELSADAASNLERLPGGPPIALGDPSAREALEDASVVVDALLGTGFAGVPSGTVAEAIEAINRACGPVVAVDVPSGVDASTGTVAGVAVEADVTVTFHVAKPGLWIHPGKGRAGEIVTIDIGVPRGDPSVPDVGLIDSSVIDPLPCRTSRSTKFTSGHVVVLGGSSGLMGAPAMAALAAMRAGAGYVTACVPASLCTIVDTQLMEVMTRALPDAGGSFSDEAVDAALDVLAKAGALALGPGLGREDGAVSLARLLARAAPLPTVIDADGLNAHARRLADLASREHPTILTPHAGELARLLGVPNEQVEAERLRHARSAAEQSGSVVVLKGDDTLVVDPAGRTAISRGASPSLATAGTGDVLTGAIAAFLAQGLDPFTAAAAGVFVHCEAGREAARRIGAAEGVMAGDVIDALPAARMRREAVRNRSVKAPARGTVGLTSIDWGS